MTDRIRPSFTFSEDKIAELKAIVPEAFEDGKINWETLREALGDYLTDSDASDEHFGLNWPGKREARRLAAKPSHGTLMPAPGEGVNEDTTGNLFIEGDNLEVLKLLQKSYAGRIKMIYIDPPYNTGNDFVYKDDYSEPLEDYLRRSGQKSDRGELLTSNPKSSGKFHTNWLNMIYPRLRLARTLLRDDGVILISIDDNEIHNLRSVLDEIFGAENFVASIIWEKKFSPQNDDKYLTATHDFILLFAKNKETWRPFLLPRNDDANNRFKNMDNDSRGPWSSGDMTSKTKAKGHSYPVESPSGKVFYPQSGRQWAPNLETYKRLRAENRIWFGESGSNFPRVKQFLSEIQQGIVPMTIWKHGEVGHNQEAKQQLNALMDGQESFDTPKPVRLIKRMLELSTTTNDGDMILDFFSGSATTAHAVLQTNREDSGNRKFIQIQIPESTPKNSGAEQAGFKTVAEIGKERIRRVIANLNEQQSLDMCESPEDLGFKVYKLSSSNFKGWKEYEGEDLQAIQTLFDEQESPLVEGWTPEGVLTEILLIEGFPLDSKTELQPQFTTNTVSLVSSPACGHRLWICLDATIQESTLGALALKDGDKFICLDSAIDDNNKIRLTQAGSLKTI